MKHLVKRDLKSLGLTCCYCGWKPAIYAILLVVRDESRLQNVMTDIYQPTADALHLHPYNVERNIRTLVQRAWQVDKQRLACLAGYKLDAPPSASQFIEIIASHVRDLSS